MRKIMVFGTALCLGGAAHAQSTTNCNTFGSTVRCTTTPDVGWQNQQNLNQAAANFGAAIAARRERKRQERALAETAAAQAATQAAAAAAETARQAAITAAENADTAVQLPTPSEEPVLLACKVEGYAVSLALYEKHNRVDETIDGISKSRVATFSTAAVTWLSPLVRSSLSRLDGSYTIDRNIPEVEAKSFFGTCAVSTARKF